MSKRQYTPRTKASRDEAFEAFLQEACVTNWVVENGEFTIRISVYWILNYPDNCPDTNMAAGNFHAKFNCLTVGSFPLFGELEVAGGPPSMMHCTWLVESRVVLDNISSSYAYANRGRRSPWDFTHNISSKLNFTTVQSIQSSPHGPALTHLKWPAARHSCSKLAFKQKCLQLAFERTVVR